MSAQLRLRNGAARLVWPPGAARGAAVLLGDAPEPLCRALAGALGALILTAPAHDGAGALGWLTDHAAQLGARGEQLTLAGVHEAAAAVTALALRARDDGWPRISRQLLVHPRLEDPPTAGLAGVAPATVVGPDAGARAYVAALRRAGVAARTLEDLRELG